MANLRAGVYVGGALFRDDRLLVLRRTDRAWARWDLPGGSVEEGETLTEALRREFREETGFRVRVDQLFDASTFRLPGQGAPVIVGCEFLCSTASRGPPRLSPEEHDRYAWLGRGERVPFARDFGRIAARAFEAHDRRRRRPT